MSLFCFHSHGIVAFRVGATPAEGSTRFDVAHTERRSFLDGITNIWNDFTSEAAQVAQTVTSAIGGAVATATSAIAEAEETVTKAIGGANCRVLHGCSGCLVLYSL